MTEAEWLAGGHVGELIDYLRETGRAGARRSRLYACALARLLWDGLGHDAHRRLVESAEAFADGRIPFGALAEARAVASGFPERYTAEGFDGEKVCPGRVAFDAAREDAAAGAWWAWGNAALVCEYLPQVPGTGRIDLAGILRDIFGNPFRPVPFAAEWRTDTALALARQMYESRDFSAMPILADALQDAGCDSDDVLNHCREAGAVHVRGCWVCDLVLGKE
jgi:hypothetical protein